MQRIVKLRAFFLSLLLCLSLILTTSSHSTDTAIVNPSGSDSSVYTTITLRDNGGITPQMLLDVVSERLGRTVDADELAKLGLIRPIEKDFFDSRNSVTTDMIWRTLMPLYGIFPYPADFYHDLLPDEDYGDIYTETYIAAILSGITTPDQLKTRYMTPETFQALVEKLNQGYFLTIDNPPVPLPDSIASTTWTRENYHYRNAILIATYLLPEGWYDDFQAQHWKLQYEPDFAKLKNSVRGDYSSSQYAGLTSYNNKTIYLRQCDDLVVFHEFVHYAAYRAGWNSWVDKNKTLQSCFTEEASGIADLLRDYAQTNADEYFADFVAYWLIYPELHTDLILKAPKTSALAVRLIDEYTTLLSR